MKETGEATDHQIRRTLLQDVLELHARINEATRELEAVTGQIPSGLPHPDGVQRIKAASNRLAIARKKLVKAHRRLHDHFGRGIVPEDLKP